MALLSQEEINSRLKNYSGWELDGMKLKKEFEFPTFSDSMIFVNEIAQASEGLAHYPLIQIDQNKVVITTTPSVAGISEKDISLIQRIQETEKMILGELEK